MTAVNDQAGAAVSARAETVPAAVRAAATGRADSRSASANALNALSEKNSIAPKTIVGVAAAMALNAAVMLEIMIDAAASVVPLTAAAGVTQPKTTMIASAGLEIMTPSAVHQAATASAAVATAVRTATGRGSVMPIIRAAAATVRVTEGVMAAVTAFAMADATAPETAAATVIAMDGVMGAGMVIVTDAGMGAVTPIAVAAMTIIAAAAAIGGGPTGATTAPTGPIAKATGRNAATAIGRRAIAASSITEGTIRPAGCL